ncbi:MAG: methyl-accepting chemotaxis protein [Treponema sp.]
MFQSKKNSKDSGGSLQPLIKSGIVFSTKEVESLMTEVENIAMNLKTRISGASKVLFKNLDQEQRFEAFSESMRLMLNSIISVQDQLQEIHKCSAALEDTADNASSSVEQITDSVSRVAQIVSDRMTLTSQLTDAVGKGTFKVKELLTVMDGLNQNIDAVKDIIAAINDVSAQTNLLAMNAAIESAHAGKAGLGFAVVAGEIRKLSEATALNAADASKTLKNMVEALRSARDTANETRSAMDWIGNSVKETTGSFEEISSEMNRLAGTGTSVRDAVMQVPQSASDLNIRADTAMDHINQIAGEVGTGKDNLQVMQKNSYEISDLMSSALFNMNSIIDSAIHIDDFSIKGVDIEEGKSITEERSVPYGLIILKHLAWVTKVRALIDGKIGADSISLGDHTRCDLGQWLEKTAMHNEKLVNRPDFRKLLKEHEQLHDIVKIVFQQINNLSKAELETYYSRLLEHSGTVIDCISALRQFIDHS